MSAHRGQFVWYELMTTDVERAKTFYGDVVGWGNQDASHPGMNYTLFTFDSVHVAGLMTLPEEARKIGVPPSWIGYVAVDDVDESTNLAKAQGGTIHVPPRDIPNVGRFSVIADPQGASLALFKSKDAGSTPPTKFGERGHVGWHELMAEDWQKAFDFYQQMFGWQKADAVDMGQMGTYQLFSAGAHPIGGMFSKPPTVPMPFWMFYFDVDAVDPAAERVKKGGGQVLMGSMEVPGGRWIVQCMDPAGALFALLGSKT